MTVRRRAALRKAQLTSARKRKKMSKKRRVALGVLSAGVVSGAIFGAKNKNRFDYVFLTIKNVRKHQKYNSGIFFKRGPQGNEEKYVYEVARQSIRREMKAQTLRNSNPQSSRRANKQALRRRNNMKAI